ncbi:hypothetical protein U9M48_041082 [Paspalum notatum var. saurae]|uniref:Uncharacterized protein n=1 Tax=Paspalum notatum var. saurae TaxID=547442 RepID=A0AAQ3UMG1_PASNO
MVAGATTPLSSTTDSPRSAATTGGSASSVANGRRADDSGMQRPQATTAASAVSAAHARQQERTAAGDKAMPWGRYTAHAAQLGSTSHGCCSVLNVAVHILRLLQTVLFLPVLMPPDMMLGISYLYNWLGATRSKDAMLGGRGPEPGYGDLTFGNHSQDLVRSMIDYVYQVHISESINHNSHIKSTMADPQPLCYFQTPKDWSPAPPNPIWIRPGHFGSSAAVVRASHSRHGWAKDAAVVGRMALGSTNIRGNAWFQ